MGQKSPPRRRALIVEDDFFSALELKFVMADLGFEVCELAPSDRRARSLAMRDQPDIALVDVCLAGGREGIETARWLREVCGASIVFVTAAYDSATSSAFANACRERPWYRSRFILPVWPALWRVWAVITHPRA